jgi:hypothetical protein
VDASPTARFWVDPIAASIEVLRVIRVRALEAASKLVCGPATSIISERGLTLAAASKRWILFPKRTRLDISFEKSELKLRSAPSARGDPKVGRGRSSTNHSVSKALGAADCGRVAYMGVSCGATLFN